MNKYFFAIGILIFVLVTVFVMSSKDSAKIKQVRIINENFVIKNVATPIETQDVKVSNVKVEATTANVDLKKSVDTKISSLDSSVENMAFRTQTSDINFYNSNSTTYNEDIRKYNNQKMKLDQAEYNAKNYNRNSVSNTEFKRMYDNYQNTQQSGIGRESQDRYIDRDVDWNTWKSNFVNTVLDDSEYIHTLDDYGMGTWFYYSFNVTYDGRIQDIKVFSMYLDPKDKDKITRLIASYAYKPITKFPKHTKRKIANVSAVVLLGSQEKRSNPSDFNENEKVRIKY